MAGLDGRGDGVTLNLAGQPRQPELISRPPWVENGSAFLVVWRADERAVPFSGTQNERQPGSGDYDRPG